MGNIVVQKFGGTSLRTKQALQKAVEKVEAVKEEGFRCAVVVSAMGRDGDSYATDTLASLIKKEGETLWKRDRDLLISCGEVISAAVFADALRSRGHKAAVLNGQQAGILTDSHYGNGTCISVDPVRIQEMLEQNIIPVVTGFQGVSEMGDIITLGRGGSDITAVLLGDALEAERVDIFTDVDGIMTADPRVVEKACVLREISYGEVYQMADQGANVIHPRAVEAAQKAAVDIVVKNTFTNDPGTKICSEIFEKTPQRSKKLVCAVTRLNGRTQLRLEGTEVSQQNEFLRLLAEEDISVDLINIGRQYCTLTIDEKKTKKVLALAETLSLPVQTETGCAKVSVVGNRMRGQPGVMSTVLNALMRAGVPLLQTADSHTTISCLVAEKHSETAMRVLHHAFDLDKTENA